MFATTLMLCTFASCNVYYVDTAENSQECQINKSVIQLDLGKALAQGSGSVARYLKQYQIVEQMSQIQSYDLDCQNIPDYDIP